MQTKYTIRSHSGSALMVTIALMGILAFMMILLLEKILPSSRTIRGVENSTVALYHSNSAIEKALSTMNYKKPGEAVGSGSITLIGSSNKAEYTIAQSDTVIPSPGKGNSEYDSNWNRIGTKSPAQLIIKNAFIAGSSNLDDVQFDIRMPKIGSVDATAGQSNSTIYFTGSATYPVINFSLTNNIGGGFYADFSTITPTGCPAGTVQNKGFTADRINVTTVLPSVGDVCVWDSSKSKSIVGGVRPLSEHLSDPANASFCANGCTMKFSVIGVLNNKILDPIPYLEYRLRKNVALGSEALPCFSNYPPNNTSCNVNPFRLNTPLALPFTTILSEGLSYGFKRSLERSLRQTTTGQEFDFTVFQ